MNTDSVQISVRDFLQSGRLSNGVVLLNDDNKAGPIANGDSNICDGGDGKSQRRQIIENAARVALLLTRSFVSFCQLSGIRHDVVSHDLSSIQLDDFFVKFSEGCTIFGVDFVFPSRRAYYSQGQQQQQQQRYSKATPMQILGHLLYSVFSKGDPPPSDLLITTPPITQETAVTCVDNGEGNNERRSSKSLRTSEIGVFSRLLELKTVPISICRFLSDMVDIGPNGQADLPFTSFQDILQDIGPKGKADCPFTSFEDVIQDLEHMTSQPKIFLHDSCFPHGEPAPPMFGNIYYGRKEEAAKIMKITIAMEQSLHQTNIDCERTGAEAVFVSGIAGIGKSHLVQAVGETLSTLGWIVIKAKFERGMEHASRRIVSSMFDEVISYLVKMKEGGSAPDVAYSQRASKTILDAIGYNGLSLLVDFLPSLPLLFEGIGANGRMGREVEITADWQLIYSLSKILEAVLEPNRFIMICSDDLQWADQTSLHLISEVLLNTGSSKHTSRRCLFVGLYRDNEFTQHSSFLQMNSNINTTEIKLSSLLKKDVTDMIMAELRLPRRLVVEFANVVHKKTSGHAYFAVELLNSLLRQYTVTYSTQKRRYDWDQVRIDMIQTGDSVAGLIASNLSSLPPTSQRVLQILSCFGRQTDIPLFRILEKFQKGIISSLEIFIEKGILERGGPIVIFTHDLIQQEAYESMSLAERQKLHLEIGQFLGSMASIDCPPAFAVTNEIDQLQLNDQAFFAGRSMTSSLISLACDQINSAGPESISDHGEGQIKRKFAEWNLSAGQKSSHQSNFRAALYYFSKGIAFLGNDCWLLTGTRLCLELHEGAVVASFALGEYDNVTRYAERMTGNVSFTETLEVHRVILMSLSASGKHEECISKGIEILRLLDFDIALSPTKESVMIAMQNTDSIASQYSVDHIMHLCELDVDATVKSILQIMDAFFISCYLSQSPFLPLIACAVVKFSLGNGVCEESATAFASLGILKINLEGDYAGGQKWAQVTRGIAKKYQSMKKSNVLFEIRAHMFLYSEIDIWFASPREISRKLLDFHHDGMRMGHIDTAMYSLVLAWRYRLFGGENLAIISQSAEDRLKLAAKHSKHAAGVHVALDNVLLMELKGKYWDCFSVFEGSICNMNDLQAAAESSKDIFLLLAVPGYNMLLAYWRGDYLAAEKFSHIVSKTNRTSKTPTFLLVYFTLFRGLIACQLYRKIGGNHRLAEGKEMMDEMETWALNSKAVFENKWLLLKAEYSASIQQYVAAQNLYKTSIQVAQDHGNIHELGLAYELLGNYYSAYGSREDSNDCLKKAHVYYTQWGATAVAEKLVRDHNLDMTSMVEELRAGNSKHSRQGE